MALVDAEALQGPTDYKKLNIFEIGGKRDPRAGLPRQRRPLPGLVPDRPRLFDRWDNPTHYAVVQVQPVIPQEAKPGEPPPAAEGRHLTKPRSISVVLVRDLGDVRLIPFLYFVISLSLFIIFASDAAPPGEDPDEEQGEAEAAGRGRLTSGPVPPDLRHAGAGPGLRRA